MSVIPINKPSITNLEIEYVNDAIKNGWGENCYNYINKFEKLFSNHIGTNYAVATSSCTGAIHLSLLALGIGPGDQVIVPELTWVATVEPVLYLGAEPIIVDVEKDTWCIDPRSIEEAITNKTKAIIVVHLYGNVCQMDEIMKIANKHNLKVLEDSAEGIGSKFDSKRVGSIGDLGVFSFHGTKTVTTGEGGMIVTNSEKFAKKIRILNNHGRNPEDPDHSVYWMRNYGYKYKISNIQAAIGCAQTERINELIEKKIKIFNWYKELLGHLPVKLNPKPAKGENGFWLPTIIDMRENYYCVEEVISKAKTKKIDLRPFFSPLSSLPFLTNKNNKVAYSLSTRGINLPSFHDITYKQCKDVVKFLDQFF